MSEPTVGGSLAVADIGRVRVLTLNRPRKRNAIDSGLWLGIVESLAEADRSREIDAVVITGTDPAFCSGVDLSLRTELSEDLLTTSPVDGILGCSVPVIAAVNGAAVTGGLEVALACDVLVASEHASVRDTHASMGVFPLWGLTYFLPRAVGMWRAKEIMTSGRVYSAGNPMLDGIFNHVVPHEELLEFSCALAADMGRADPKVIAATLDLLDSERKAGLGSTVTQAKKATNRDDDELGKLPTERP